MPDSDRTEWLPHIPRVRAFPLMPVRTDLTDALLALIPDDGSRLSNEQLRAALAQEADERFSDEEFEAAKDHVVAMGAAEKARGPGGGLKAAGVSPPPRPAPASGNGNGRGRRNGNGSATASAQPTIAPGTTAASVLTGELRNQIDGIWNAFWSGGIANPLEVLEQLTYLLFIRRLDELETLEERKPQRTGQPMTRRLFPEGDDVHKRPYEQLRWSRFNHLAPGRCSPWWARACSPSCAPWAAMARPTPAI